MTSRLEVGKKGQPQPQHQQEAAQASGPNHHRSFTRWGKEAFLNNAHLVFATSNELCILDKRCRTLKNGETITEETFFQSEGGGVLEKSIKARLKT